MGILKFAAKAVGTVALTATGTASAVLQKLINMSGNDPSQTILPSIQDKSFDSIKKMWKPEEYEDELASGKAEINSLRRQYSSKTSAASTLRNMANNFKAKGDMEHYEEYMSRYYTLVEDYHELKREIDHMEYENSIR